MILPFKQGQINEVYTIELESFSSPWPKNQFSSYCNNNSENKSFIYIKQKNIIGYLMSQTILEEVHLHNIAVKKSHRGNGIASKMILHLIDESRMNNKSKICLEVNYSNISAIKLYQHHGFTAIGERVNYYEDGGNAILMDRDF